jgi:hypothetical protein
MPAPLAFRPRKSQVSLRCAHRRRRHCNPTTSDANLHARLILSDLFYNEHVIPFLPSQQCQPNDDLHGSPSRRSRRRSYPPPTPPSIPKVATQTTKRTLTSLSTSQPPAPAVPVQQHSTPSQVSNLKRKAQTSPGRSKNGPSQRAQYPALHKVARRRRGSGAVAGI